MPEILVAPLEQLEAVYREAKKDLEFHAELAQLNKNFSGRPTALYFCERLSCKKQPSRSVVRCGWS
ncbi:MAG: hypothetical protein O3A53_01615 [Acidobacteria bacterium]|nr:hypothetical protein [Acidobacteriota bacterium]MDA1233479.1 hypothetical protein [Acidobacteriota bacterium]